MARHQWIAIIAGAIGFVGLAGMRPPGVLPGGWYLSIGTSATLLAIAWGLLFVANRMLDKLEIDDKQGEQ